MLFQIQALISHQKHPLFIVHSRSHTTLPGLMTKGNAIADSLTVAILQFDYVRASHSFFHQNAAGLHKQFKISLFQTKDIIRSCPDYQ